jgi:hypothetical protein
MTLLSLRLFMILFHDYFTKLQPTTIFGQSFFALGMACYSNAWGVPEAMMYANMEYANALHLINSALRDPFGAKQDEIFLIVMLLGLDEVNVLLNWF